MARGCSSRSWWWRPATRLSRRGHLPPPPAPLRGWRGPPRARSGAGHGLPRRVEFAVGHGVSVHADTAAGRPERAVRVATPRGARPTRCRGRRPLRRRYRPPWRALVLDMKRWPRCRPANCSEHLAALPDAYADLARTQQARVDGRTPAVARRVPASVRAPRHGGTARSPGAHPRGHRAAGPRPAGRRGLPLHEPRHVAAAHPLALRRGRCGRGDPLHAGGARRPREPQLAPLPARLHPAQPAGAHRPRASRSRRGSRGHRRPALVPHRRRQDRGLPRPHRLHPRHPPPAGRGGRPRRRARGGGADALHPAPAHPAAVPARRGADLRLRDDPPRGARRAATTAGARRRSASACGSGSATTPNTAPAQSARGDQASCSGSPAPPAAVGSPAAAHDCPWCGTAIDPQAHIKVETVRQRPRPHPHLLRRPLRATAPSASARAPARACRCWWWTRRSTGCCPPC